MMPFFQIFNRRIRGITKITSNTVFFRCSAITMSSQKGQVPEIMVELNEVLRRKGHCCGSYIGSRSNPGHDYKFSWCQKDVCAEAMRQVQMDKGQQQQDALLEKIQQEGHTCWTIQETYPSRLRWCERKICTKTKHK